MVPALDYAYEAMQPCPKRLCKVQRAMDHMLTRALCMPRNVPCVLLWTPLDCGGFRIPHHPRSVQGPATGELMQMESKWQMETSNNPKQHSYSPIAQLLCVYGVCIGNMHFHIQA